MCRDDPVVCLDSVILFVGEYLMDWTTMAMLLILLALLLKLRADRAQARNLAFAERLGAYERKREQQSGLPV